MFQWLKNQVSGLWKPKAPPPPKAPATIGYQVVKGDTLSEIAQRYGIDLQDLLAVNPRIKDPDYIQTGQVIQIPKAAADALEKKKVQVAKQLDAIGHSERDTTANKRISEGDKLAARDADWADDERMGTTVGYAMTGFLASGKKIELTDAGIEKQKQAQALELAKQTEAARQAKAAQKKKAAKKKALAKEAVETAEAPLEKPVRSASKKSVEKPERVVEQKPVAKTGSAKKTQKSESVQKSQAAEAPQTPPKVSTALLKKQLAADADPKLTTKGAAQRLYKAMKGLGTNEAEIFRTLANRSSEEIRLIRADFESIAGETLDKWLGEELNPDHLRRAKLLLEGNEKYSPERDAEIIDLAMKRGGTDEKTVLDVLYGKTADQRRDIAAAYKTLTGKSLEQAIRAEHSGADEVYALATLKRGKVTDADKIRAAMAGGGTDEEAIFKALKGKTKEQLEQLTAEYNKNYPNHDLAKDLVEELSSADLVKAEALLKTGKLTGADEVKMALVGLRIDKQAIKDVFRGKTEEQIAAIKADYAEKYGDLDADLEGITGVHKDEIESLMANGELSAAEKLNSAFRGFWMDKELVFETLDGLSTAELKQVHEEYFEKYKKTLDQEIEGMSGHDKNRAKILAKNGKLSVIQKVNFSLAGAKNDTEMLFRALEEASPEERDLLKEEYKILHNTSVEDLLKRELFGRDRHKALLLLENGPLSPQQEADVAMHGVGVREKDLYAALGRATPTERKEMQSDTAFMKQLKEELRGEDLKRAEILLEKGELTRIEKLHFAMAGNGTDEDLVFEALAGLSVEQRKTLIEDYEKKYERPLRDDLKADLGKRDLLKASDALQAPPESMRERIDRMQERCARERNSGSAIGNASDAIMDVFSNSGFEIEQELREYKRVAEEAKKGGDLKKAETRLQAGETRLEKLTAEYQAEKDSVADTAASVATIAAAAAAVAATGGLAAPAAVAICGTTAGLTKVGTKQLIVGDSYDLIGVDGATDFAVGATEGVAMFAMGAAGDKITASIGQRYLAAQGKNVGEKGLMLIGRQALRSAGETVTKQGAKRAAFEVCKRAGEETIKRSIASRVGVNGVIGGIKGAIYMGAPAAMQTALDEETMNMELGDALQKVLKESGAAAKDGAVLFGAGMAGYNVTSSISNAVLKQAQFKVGSRLAVGKTFSDKKLLKAGYQVLGDEAKTLSQEVIKTAGRHQMLIDMGRSHLERTSLRKLLIHGSKEIVNAGGAGQHNALVGTVGDHDTWKYGMDHAMGDILGASAHRVSKDGTSYGLANSTIRAYYKPNSGRAANALQSGLSALMARSIRTLWE